MSSASAQQTAASGHGDSGEEVAMTRIVAGGEKKNVISISRTGRIIIIIIVIIILSYIRP